MEIKLTTALPIGTAGTAEVWVGNGCDNYTTRSTPNQTACQKVTALPINNFSSSSTSNGLIEIPLPGNELASPQPNGGTHVCTTATTSNSAYVFLYTDPSNPFASCTLNLTEQNQGPGVVTSPSAGSGDSAVNLQWVLPPAGSYVPTQFQILCSDDDGNPITNSPPAPLYSTCINGTLARRNISTGGALGTTTDDAGTTVFDLAFPISKLPSGVQPEATADLAPPPPDMSENPVWKNDGGLGFLADLDPKYLCTAQIGATSTSQRISGLTNFKLYHFLILSIDNYGNATPSTLVSGTPQPVEDLYRRYRDEGGAAGGCFIATAAFGSYESGWVHVLRDFRDEVLLPTSLGHDLVEWYYAHSPPAAAWLTRHPWPRALVRGALVPVIALAGAWVYSAPWQKAVLMLLLMAFVMRRRLAAVWHGGPA